MNLDSLAADLAADLADRGPLWLAGPALWGLAAASAAGLAGPAWDAVAALKTRRLEPRLRDLGMDLSKLPTWRRAWGAALVASVAIFAGLGLWPLAVVAALAVFLAPDLILSVLLARRTKRLRDQMVGAGTALANASRAGLSISQGFEELAKDTPDPLGVEFRRITAHYRHGRPLAEILTETRRRLDLDGFSLFANAILVCLTRGGKETDALERISRSLQENQRLERKLEADTAAGKWVVILLAGFPLLFLAGFAVLFPEGTSLLFTTLIGQGVLVAVVVVTLGCAYLASRVLSIEF